MNDSYQDEDSHTLSMKSISQSETFSTTSHHSKKSNYFARNIKKRNALLHRSGHHNKNLITNDDEYIEEVNGTFSTPQCKTNTNTVDSQQPLFTGENLKLMRPNSAEKLTVSKQKNNDSNNLQRRVKQSNSSEPIELMPSYFDKNKSEPPKIGQNPIKTDLQEKLSSNGSNESISAKKLSSSDNNSPNNISSSESIENSVPIKLPSNENFTQRKSADNSAVKRAVSYTRGVISPETKSNTELMKRFERENANITAKNKMFPSIIAKEKMASKRIGINELITQNNDYMLHEESSDIQYVHVRRRKKVQQQIEIKPEAIDTFFASSAYAITQNFAPKKIDDTLLKRKPDEIVKHSNSTYNAFQSFASNASVIEDSFSDASYQYSKMNASIDDVAQKTSIVEDKADVLLDNMDLSSETVGFLTVFLQNALKFVALIYWAIMCVVGFFMNPCKKRQKMSYDEAKMKLHKKLSQITDDSENETGTGTSTDFSD